MSESYQQEAYVQTWAQRKLDEPVLEAADAYEQSLGDLPPGFPSRAEAEFRVAVRARREAMKPKPRYSVNQHVEEQVTWVNDAVTGRPLSLAEIVALLNRQEEK